MNVVVSSAWMGPRLPLEAKSISPGWTAMLFDKSGSSQDVASKIIFVGAGVHEILTRVHWHRELCCGGRSRSSGPVGSGLLLPI